MLKSGRFYKCSFLKYFLILHFLKNSNEIQVIHEVDEGENVSLSCYPFEDLKSECAAEWKKHNVTVDFHSTSRIRTDVKHSLIIDKVFEEDSGNYTCVVTCPSEQRESETFIRVRSVPNQPQITGIECEGLQSILYWKTSSDPKVPVLNHKIQYRNNFTNDQWSDVFDSLPPSNGQIEIALQPWTTNVFRVISKNRVGESKPSLPSNPCEAPPDVPYKNPENVFGFGTEPNNLVILWDSMKPSEHNGPDFYYQIHYRLDIPDTNWTEVINIADWSTTQYELFDQPSFQRYRIKIEAFNSLGRAKEKANEVIGFSGEDKPALAPSNLTLLRIVNATAAEIRWDPVPVLSLNGYLRGYKVQTRYSVGDSEETREMLIESSSTQCLIDNLWPFSRNLIQVFVCNGQFESNPSNILIIQTPEGVPEAVETMECDSAESYTLNISWKKPLQINGILVGYKLIWAKILDISAEETECSKYIRNATITTTTLDVTHNTTYRITIRAMTSTGVGEPYSIECSTPIA